MVPRQRIAVIRTGGTIDAVGASRLDLAWYYLAGERVPPGGLVGALPELAEVADVEELEVARRSSSSITPADWLELARTVASLVTTGGYDGVVIAHGTNTLEETAWFLDLTLTSPAPVVMVGAMRPPSGLGADGPLNLFRAVQVAASSAARGQCVLVVMDDRIFAARDVTKTSTFRVDSLQAPDTGPLGYADADGRLVFYHRHVGAAVERPHFDVQGLDDLPRVDVVVSYVGADGVFIDAAVAAGARGIVSAGTGAGRPTAAEDEALDRAIAAGVVVCQSTRVGSGRVARTPAMERRGVITADNLQPWKARVLLSLALTRTEDPEAVQELFDRL